MNGIEHLFEAGSVIWELEHTEKFAAIHELIYRAKVFDVIGDLAQFERTVADRERLQSTGFGHGVAVAHGRTTKVEALRIALGISRKGIAFEAVDDNPVHLLFIIANHPDRQMDYLQILSNLISLVRKESFRGELLSCVSTKDVERKLCGSLTKLLSRVRVNSVA